jgi:hydroxyacylglutathione hydrolase
LAERTWHPATGTNKEDVCVIVEQIWTGNNLRNFNYLIVCPQTGDALAIDPLEHRAVLERAKERGWTITQIVNTHEHHDHIDGNQPLVAATGAKVLAHAGASGKIPNLDRGLAAGDRIQVGKEVTLRVLDTPGHTMSHVCLLSDTDVPGLFSGDTLFNAGAGNCHHGGHPSELYSTFAQQLAVLPDTTKIYPGHDYIANNLRFTLDREPGNSEAQSLLTEIQDQNPARAKVTTLELEKRVNTFFRLQSPGVIERLRDSFPELGDAPDARTVFLKLRELRNKW